MPFKLATLTVESHAGTMFRERIVASETFAGTNSHGSAAEKNSWELTFAVNQIMVLNYFIFVHFWVYFPLFCQNYTPKKYIFANINFRG